MYNGHVRLRTGQWSNRIKWHALVNHIFFCITWTGRYMCVYLTREGKHMRRRQVEGGSVTLWATLCWWNLLTLITYQSIAADQVHYFLTAVFPNGSDLLTRIMCTNIKIVQVLFKEHNNGFKNSPEFQRSVLNWAFVSCAGHISPSVVAASMQTSDEGLKIAPPHLDWYVQPSAWSGQEMGILPLLGAPPTPNKSHRSMGPATCSLSENATH